ncbi:MAG: glycoside hydrolase family 88 protein [bacterium]
MNQTGRLANRMKWRRVNLVMGIVILFSLSFSENVVIHKNFDTAWKQLIHLLSVVGDSKEHPYSVNPDNHLRFVPAKHWTSGFFPGCLWLLYEYSGDAKWQEAARKFTENLEMEQYNGGTHDMGFKMFCSYGNGYRLTNDLHYKQVLLQSAKTLMTRFNPKVGCIRSWDHHADVWQYPVIIDNMMNLELLFWATKESGDSTFYDVAVTHANTTIMNHFRGDYSTWHVIDYDTTTGAILGRDTHQGYAPESCWARGQAWGLYGFTMCHRETGDQRYLVQAEKMAEFILNHDNLPDDMIPYWDFDAPNIPNEERDSSAGAIICAALYELSLYSGKNAEKYRSAADKMLETLSSVRYLAKVGDNCGFVLMHGVASKRSNSEVDRPLVYADYYFLEANLRKLRSSSK